MRASHSAPDPSIFYGGATQVSEEREDVDAFMAGRGGLFADRPAAPLPPPAPTLKPLPATYQNETTDSSPFRGGDAAGIDKMWSAYARDPDSKFTSVATDYWDNATQAAHELKVGQGGKLQDASGMVADTAAASGIGTAMSAGAGRHIFALSHDDKLRAADPWAEHSESARPGLPNESHLGTINHSSLVAGNAVKAAGELKIEDGNLQEVSDASGHYLPTNAMTRQALDHLQGGGVDMHDVQLKLMNKKPGAGPALRASAREFMATQDAMSQRNAVRAAAGGAAEYDMASPGAVENQMLDSRARMKAELAANLAARQGRIAGGGLRVTGGKASAEMRGAAERWAAEAEGGAAPEHAPGSEPVPAATRVALQPSLSQQLRGKLSEREARLRTGAMQVTRDGSTKGTTRSKDGEVHKVKEKERAGLFVASDAFVGADALHSDKGVALPVAARTGSDRTRVRYIDEHKAMLRAQAAPANDDDTDSESDSDASSTTSDTSETTSATAHDELDDDWDSEADGDLDDIFEAEAEAANEPSHLYGAPPEDLFANQY